MHKVEKASKPVMPPWSMRRRVIMLLLAATRLPKLRSTYMTKDKFKRREDNQIINYYKITLPIIDRLGNKRTNACTTQGSTYVLYMLLPAEKI